MQTDPTYITSPEPVAYTTEPKKKGQVATHYPSSLLAWKLPSDPDLLKTWENLRQHMLAVPLGLLWSWLPKFLREHSVDCPDQPDYVLRSSIVLTPQDLYESAFTPFFFSAWEKYTHADLESAWELAKRICDPKDPRNVMEWPCFPFSIETAWPVLYVGEKKGLWSLVDVWDALTPMQVTSPDNLYPDSCRLDPLNAPLVPLDPAMSRSLFLSHAGRASDRILYWRSVPWKDILRIAKETIFDTMPEPYRSSPRIQGLLAQLTLEPLGACLPAEMAYNAGETMGYLNVKYYVTTAIRPSLFRFEQPDATTEDAICFLLSRLVSRPFHPVMLVMCIGYFLSDGDAFSDAISRLSNKEYVAFKLPKWDFLPTFVNALFDAARTYSPGVTNV